MSKLTSIKSESKKTSAKQSEDFIPKDYKAFLDDLKIRIRSTQLKAAVKVNSELINLYWSIGRDIIEKQKKEGWGSLIIERLGKDLQNAFPGVEGFSRRNLFYMKKFAADYKDSEIVQQAVALIPWGHTVLLLNKVKNQQERIWYSKQTIQCGWSRRALDEWIKSDLYNKQGKAVFTNFTEKLPHPQSALAQETLKDPYNFDFLALTKDYKEQELEQGLIDHIQKLLIELGQGFAFLGRQYPLTVDGDLHYIDLLFYHVKLHSYVVVELKATSFDPRDAGQMNFYLSAVDAMLKTPQDNPSIGLLLCRDKKGLKVEYALQDIRKPIGIASYEVTLLEKLPKELKGSLPSIQELEAELENV